MSDLVKGRQICFISIIQVIKISPIKHTVVIVEKIIEVVDKER